MGAFVGAEMRSTQRCLHALTPPCTICLYPRLLYSCIHTRPRSRTQHAGPRSYTALHDAMQLKK